MRTKTINFMILIFFSLFCFSCISTTHVERTNQSDFTKPLPSLLMQLNDLYQQNQGQWKQKMNDLILSGHPDIPLQHLIHAIDAFNRLQDRKVCLEASFMYLKQKAVFSRSFKDEDRLLFSKLSEYAIRTPDAFDISRIQILCENVRDSICDELR